MRQACFWPSITIGPRSTQRRLKFTSETEKVLTSFWPLISDVFRAGSSLNGCRISGIENTQELLRINGHVPHGDCTAHEGRPWFFRDRLQLSKVPELLLHHLDLGNPVPKDPGAQHAKTALLRIAEHRFR